MATEQQTQLSGEQLEQELARLLDQETFDPPAEFREQALISDESVYEEAERDFAGWWEKQADALDWAERWDQALDESGAPF
jgi:acetyl-CoA synthetase